MNEKIKQKIRKSLVLDSKFLAKQGIMDYSLLVAIEKKEKNKRVHSSINVDDLDPNDDEEMILPTATDRLKSQYKD